MAGNTATLTVRIIGDSTSAQHALNQVTVDIQQAEQATQQSSKKMSVSWAAVAASMLAVVRASSMTESATYALNTVFGEQGDEMVAWAEGMAEYGLSTAQAGAAAAVLGAQLKNAGFSAEQMTVITQGLVETAAALSHVMGVSAVDAAAAMGAALRGEYDSLEALGITLTADAVATEMLRLSQEGATFATEQQGKAVATLSLIQQGATAILEDAEEGVVTMSMATDHLKASTMNLASAIGDVLTPILGPLIENVATVMDTMTGAIKESELLADVSAALANVLAAVAEILDPVLLQALNLITSAANALWSILEPFLVPILNALAVVLDLVADALAVVIGWVESAIDAFERFVDIVHEAIDSLSFWNDTYSSSPPPTAYAAAAARIPHAYGRAGVAPLASSGRVVNVTVQAGMIADPHGLAQEIRRVLRLDAARMGRPVTV